MNQFQGPIFGDGALNWIDWTLIMLKSMMQPPQSKLSSAESFGFVLMPVFLIGSGSQARSGGTFGNVDVDVGDLQDGQMILGFQLHLF